MMFSAADISQSVKKTDRRDAALLAEYLEKNLPPEVRRKSVAASELAQLAQARDQLVKMRTIIYYTLKKQWIFTDFAAFAVENQPELLDKTTWEIVASLGMTALRTLDS